MKKYLLALLCCASLSASQFEHSITITPQASESAKKMYLAEIKVMKLFGDGSPFTVATPTLMCVEGQKAEVTVGSEEEGNLLIVSVLVPENNSDEAETSIYMKEGSEVVISEEKTIKISS